MKRARHLTRALLISVLIVAGFARPTLASAAPDRLPIVAADGPGTDHPGVLRQAPLPHRSLAFQSLPFVFGELPGLSRPNDFRVLESPTPFGPRWQPRSGPRGARAPPLR